MAGAAARAIERGGLFVRVLRTLGGRNIGKCRLRAHQHPLSPPLSNLLEPTHMQTSKARRVLQRVMNACWGMC